MPAFALVPASPSDLEAVARVQFEACAKDHGFPVVFPKGPTMTSITHTVQAYEAQMENDLSCHLMVVKDALTGDVASFAVWHFFPPRSPEDIEEEMLTRDFPLPNDANRELGNRVIHNSIRKRHEVVASTIGTNQPYAFLAAMGTCPKYQNQGAASLLLKWGLDRADDRGLSVYVESAPMALRLYKKHGFQEVSDLALDLAPWKEGEYFNKCMVRQPDT
ncbi:hypothetical protein A1O7_05996 [Cladophialophora yegresii CBS 114405]|uniref:N-acetyltransferase domain-containing protein n=1 Tax=Cladophialophora yegresii CBS 114405 TaxID=1182544 RepID=W9WJ96_9EURO|nr:uncharacterized protein A1O7_05996 [Cladophialophora yegresii CBS 114405]EXJ58569.1 hypothetical protein A1O7_05996 [Cladophialophora yegresii CBS 114405]